MVRLVHGASQFAALLPALLSSVSIGHSFDGLASDLSTREDSSDADRDELQLHSWEVKIYKEEDIVKEMVHMRFLRPEGVVLCDWTGDENSFMTDFQFYKNATCTNEGILTQIYQTGPLRNGTGRPESFAIEVHNSSEPARTGISVFSDFFNSPDIIGCDNSSTVPPLRCWSVPNRPPPDDETRTVPWRVLNATVRTATGRQGEEKALAEVNLFNSASGTHVNCTVPAPPISMMKTITSGQVSAEYKVCQNGRTTMSIVSKGLNETFAIITGQDKLRTIIPFNWPAFATNRGNVTQEGDGPDLSQSETAYYWPVDIRLYVGDPTIPDPHEEIVPRPDVGSNGTQTPIVKDGFVTIPG